MTGTLNRRGLLREFEKWHLPAKPAWVAICDVDYFKQINDAYGHAAGDVVLIGFAELLNKLDGHYKIVARVGGEEFVLVIDDMSAEAVFELLETLRKQIRNTNFGGINWSHRVTCSVGCVHLQADEDLWKAVSRADDLLYIAKRQGRDRVVLEGHSSENIIQLPLMSKSVIAKG